MNDMIVKYDFIIRDVSLSDYFLLDTPEECRLFFVKTDNSV